MDYIALSIPAFFVLIGLEVLVAGLRGERVYRFADFVANLCCGTIQQTFKIVLGLFTGVLYIYLYSNHRWLDLSSSELWVWIVCFIGVDFFYYWFHRLSHEVNFLWAAHVVHHQSEEYNLGVALRQSAFQGGFSWFFYLPLALIGFPPLVVGVLRAINALYQFWIHTQLIRRMGPFEWIFNTPSHHRVHHGRNPQYIDRNHGGTLIIWDRVFGTFEPEGETVIYGVTEPPRSWNAVFANFHHWGVMFRRSARAKTWMERLRVFVDEPGYRPTGLTETGKQDAGDKYDTPVSRPLLVYVASHFAVLMVATFTFLFYRKLVDVGPLAAWGSAIILSCGALGVLLDGKTWIRPLELFRPLVVVAVFALLLPEVLLAPVPIAVLLLASVLSAVGLRAALRMSGEDPDRGPPVAISDEPAR